MAYKPKIKKLDYYEEATETPDASSTVKGKTKLSVEPTSDPIAVGDNDPRVPAKLFQPSYVLHVYVATTGNITLSGLQTIDGEALSAGFNVLVKDQTDATENGVYQVASGAWTRSTFIDTDEEMFRAIIAVDLGTVNVSKTFANTNLTLPTLGVDDITFAEINSTQTIDSTPENQMALDLNHFLFGDLTVNGLWTFGSLQVSGSSILGTLADLNVYTPSGYHSLIIGEGYANPDGDETILISHGVLGTNLYIAGNKIQSDNDTPLILKSGSSSTFQSYLDLNGGIRHKSVTKTGNYTIDPGDHTVAYITLSAARTVTLPSLTTIVEGQEFVIIDATTGTHADTNNIIVQRSSTDTFTDGSTSKTINVANGGLKVTMLNSRWAFEFLSVVPTNRNNQTTSASTITPTGDTSDQYNVTALAANATIAAPSGTPKNGQRLILRIKDNGTARTLTWNAIYRSVGAPLPSTTVISKTLYVDMVYNTADTKWDVMDVMLEGDDSVTLSRTQTLTNKTLTSPAITTPTGIVKGDVGLGNVDNTSDVNKPISTATQTALDLKAPLASPTFTGTVTGPNIVSTSVVRLKNYTVATLPAGTQGDTAFVTDALAPTYLTAVVGGGAIVTPVFYDGTNWVAY